MKVILEKNVAGVGKAGQVVEVSDGHARNFLLPQKLARPATGNAVASLQTKQRQVQQQQVKEADRARSLVNKLNQAEITLIGPVSDHQTLYGAITPAMIAQALASQGLVVEERMVNLDHHIKQVGEYRVEINVGHGQIGRIKVIVKGE